MLWWATSQVLIRCLNATRPSSAQCGSGCFWIQLCCSRAFETVHFTSPHFTAVPMSASETVIPQCFAKAGKMEPNHLLNGFGPLQPAVAMLWWLQELLLLWCLQHNHCNDSRPLLDDDWLMAFLYQHLECSVIVMFNAKPVWFLTNKETDPSFKTWVWSNFLTECYLSASNGIDILTTLSMAVSKIAGGEGRHTACAISETQHSMPVWECVAVLLRHLLNWLSMDANSKLRCGWEWEKTWHCKEI